MTNIVLARHPSFFLEVSYNNDMSIESIVYDLEAAYVKTLQALVLSTAMTADAARDSVEAFLHIFPLIDEEDVRKKVNAYVDEYPLWASLRMVVTGDEMNIETDEKTHELQLLLHSRKIDELLLAASKRD